jgi:AAA+ ATPase superfamily predicted ATPase
MEEIIGRQEEKEILQRVAASNEAELIAIYGRRRIGKTFLIRNLFAKQIFLEFSGIHNATLSELH